MYIRLVFGSVEVYKYLEPLYNDYRKLRYMNRAGSKNFSFKIIFIFFPQSAFELLHMDEFIDNLLRDDHYCDIQLPRLQVLNLVFLSVYNFHLETSSTRGNGPVGVVPIGIGRGS